LLGVAILLRLPAFAPDFLPPEASLNLLCGEQIQGGHVYMDAWYHGPPVMVWINWLFAFVFGEGALSAMRMFSMLYVYLSALYLQAMLVEYKVFRKNELAPGLFLILLASTPWYSLQLSPALLMLLPLLFSFHTVIRLSISKKGNYRRLFQAGLLLALGVLADYHLVVFLLGILLAYLFIRQPKLDELFGLLMGVGVGLVIFTLILYYNGIGQEFWELGFLAFWQNWLLGFPELLRNPMVATYLSVAINWGPLLILALLGFFHYRAKIFSYVILIRRVEQAMILWLVSGALMVAIAGSQLTYADFLLLSPPLAFYAARSWGFALSRLLRLGAWLLVVLPPLVMGLYLLDSYAPNTLRFEANQWDGVLNNRSTLLRNDSELKAYFQGKSLDDGIWVLANRPELYLYLEGRCPNRYTDFRLVYQKFSYLVETSVLRLESDADIFESFSQGLPAYIIDQTGQFGRMQKRFPSLFHTYQSKRLGDYTIWEK
jgi:4-amino-4-deoxy-L-arabinose transferase-like glycosyltransferase